MKNLFIIATIMLSACASETDINSPENMAARKVVLDECKAKETGDKTQDDACIIKGLQAIGQI